jgi:dihydroorotase
LRMAGEIQMPLDRLVTVMSLNPARILRVEGGTLSIGAAANVTVVDPERRWVVDAARFQSKGRNTPFDGMEMRGQAVATIVGGRVVWRRDAAAPA